MTAIMCTLKLQKALLAAGQPWTRGLARATGGATRLGNWAASLAEDADPRLVVALEEHTCLTLVVPFDPADTLRERLADRLHADLLVEGLPPAAAATECEQVPRAVFVRLRNPWLTDELDFPVFEADAHGAEGHQEDQSIEDMLNAYPHTGLDGKPVPRISQWFHLEPADSAV